jgi:LacI family gluconate utilization system Gnt-I transcriptional repressor
LRKVQEAVLRTGYVPNRMAGGLASSRSRLIAAVTPSTVMSVFMGTIESLNGTLFDAGYQLMLGQTSYSAAREEALLEAIIGRRPDGIFLTGLLPPGKGRTMLLASGIPVVESWDLTPTPIDMLIGFSHSDIGRDVARYLAGRGHRKMAMVMANDERANRRATAFKEEVLQQGLPPVVEVNVGAVRSMHSGRDALTRLLQRAPDVDAVFCSSDLLALGVLTQARVLGLDVPGQLAIMGFGDTPLASDVVPALSSVRINGDEIGRLAALCLMARAEGREVPQPLVDVGFSIMARDSA